VGELQESLSRPRSADAFDDAVGHSAAAMRRQPGGLVHDDEVVVLIKDGRHQRRYWRRVVPPAGRAVRNGGTRMSSPGCTR